MVAEHVLTQRTPVRIVCHWLLDTTLRHLLSDEGTADSMITFKRQLSCDSG